LCPCQTIADTLLVSSKKHSSSSTTSSDNKALEEYRVGYFLSDPTGPINATLAFQANGNATAEDIKLAAERRMAAELLAFDNVFGQSTAGTT
jgi:hypothetical protein